MRDGQLNSIRTSLAEMSQRANKQVARLQVELEAAHIRAKDDPDWKARYYHDCPVCGADEGMGFVLCSGNVAVECYYCKFRGPEFAPGMPDRGSDKLAFFGWNDLERK